MAPLASLADGQSNEDDDVSFIRESKAEQPLKSTTNGHDTKRLATSPRLKGASLARGGATTAKPVTLKRRASQTDSPETAKTRIVHREKLKPVSTVAKVLNHQSSVRSGSSNRKQSSSATSTEPEHRGNSADDRELPTTKDADPSRPDQEKVLTIPLTENYFEQLVTTAARELRESQEYMVHAILNQECTACRHAPGPQLIRQAESPFETVKVQTRGKETCELVVREPPVGGANNKPGSSRSITSALSKVVTEFKSLPRYKSIGRLGQMPMARNVTIGKYTPYFPEDEGLPEDVRESKYQELRDRYKAFQDFYSVIQAQRDCVERCAMWRPFIVDLMDQLRIDRMSIVSFFRAGEVLGHHFPGIDDTALAVCLAAQSGMCGKCGLDSESRWEFEELWERAKSEQVAQSQTTPGAAASGPKSNVNGCAAATLGASGGFQDALATQAHNSCGVGEVLDQANKYKEEIRKNRCINNRIQLGLPARTIKAPSEVQGFGLFAGEDIPRNGFIGEYKGEVTSREECDRRGSAYHLSGMEYLFNLNQDQEVDASSFGNKTRFLNNSSNEQNINVVGSTMLCNGVQRVMLCAKRDIKAGEELLFDYKYPEHVRENFWERGEGDASKNAMALAPGGQRSTIKGVETTGEASSDSEFDPTAKKPVVVWSEEEEDEAEDWQGQGRASIAESVSDRYTQGESDRYTPALQHSRTLTTHPATTIAHCESLLLLLLVLTTVPGSSFADLWCAKMHRTYSMRQSRAPTASQLENPPPPPSSTKTGRLFGRSNIGHAFRKGTAGAFGPDLAKKLSQLVKMEKNVMRSMELVGRERMEVAQQLSLWGEGCDDDVSDVTDKLGVLIYEIGELEDQFVDRYDQYRVTIKSIRNIEASVQPSRDRKQKITDQIAQLKYKEPNSPRIVVLEQELVRAEAESLVAEAQLSNITREKLKAAFTYHFDALREHCEKMAVIAGYGKHLLELIDDTPVTPGETRAAYDGYEASKAIIQDCEDALTNWVQGKAAVKSSLSTRSRTLSQRRKKRNADGVDLSTQDQPLKSDRDSWVPAGEHGEGDGQQRWI
ncbi:hypothetical protein DV738_g2706, partial [Chaetothyriales sp. CBS 135597]